jgi:5'-nucleotidase
MTLTGAELYELLKQQWCGRERPRVLQPSAGVRYGWSIAMAAAATGQPCAMAPNPVTGLAVGGAQVTAEQTYRVTVSSLLAGGFNDFAALEGGTERADGPAEMAAVEAYMAPSLGGEPLAPPATDRIAVVP